MSCASRLLDEELLPIVDLIRVVRRKPRRQMSGAKR